MKTAMLCGIALVCSSAAFAQTPPAPAADTPKTITLTGCVGGGTNAQPITLANALVIPSTDATETATPPSPVPRAVSDPETQPPAAAGTSGTTSTTGAQAPPPAAVGTSGTITGTAPAGSSTSSISGYRLSGADMTSWVGRRVEIVGMVVPAAVGLSPKSATTTGSVMSGTITMPEFRVVSVKPATGSCSEK